MGKRKHKYKNKYSSWIWTFFGIILMIVLVGATTTITDNDITTINSIFTGNMSIINAQNFPSISIIQNGNTTDLPSIGGAINIDNTNNVGSAMIIHSNYNGSERQDAFFFIDIQNESYDGPILRINSASTDSEGTIRIDSPTPEIEFVETDQVAPLGKWELRAQNQDFQINSRVEDDSSFESYFYLNGPLWEGGQMILNANTSSESRDLFRIDNQKNSAGARPGISWRNDPQNFVSARISSDIGASGAASNFYIQVADTSKALQERFQIDVNGNVVIGNGTQQNNITLTSPDGTEFSCGVNNSGSLICT